MNIRRYLLMFIVCVSSFMIYTNNVKAYVLSGYKHFTDNYITCSKGYGYCQDSLGNMFNNRNQLRGSVIFNFTVDPQIILNSVSISNEYNEFFPCDIGGNLVYSDNTNGYYFVTAICPVTIYNNGLKNIKFTYDDQYITQNSFKFFMSDYYSFSTYDNTDYTAILTNINNNISSLITSNQTNFDSVKNYINNVHLELISINNKLNNISNKLDDIKNSGSATASNTEEIKNDIKDSSIDNDSTSSSTSGWASKNASNGTITQLLTLPIALLTNITNSINSSCSSFSLGTLFDTELVLPCINLNDYLGSSLVSIIDILFSGFMIYNIAKKLIKIFNDFTNLKSNQIDEIYGGGNE